MAKAASTSKLAELHEMLADHIRNASKIKLLKAPSLAT